MRPRPSTEARLERRGEGRFEVVGTLSFASVPALWSAAGQVLDGQGELEIDLARIERSDSAGLALLVEWLRESRRRGFRLRFTNIPEQLQAMARLSHVESLLSSAPTPAQDQDSPS